MAEVVAETERLRLRTWDDASKAEFARVTNTPAVMRWLGGVADLDKLAAAFDRLDQYQTDFGHTFWAVERKSDGALLGFCGLKRVNSPGGEALHGTFEIGWRLREDAWGQGYAKEAAIASMDLAFDHYGASHVVALTVPGNRDSQGLMRRLGMIRREDLDFVDERFPLPSELNLTIVHRIDAADWPAARAKALA
ncbi:GNAT family N-acetyltransferase [Sphingomonas sp. GCM10030256]|uniref:GNAT family N-acetyltransferase n=1 Tax=Sphingomonas sp. GCM10030256 TaxID=3273427 RepID=UPI003620783C